MVGFRVTLFVIIYYELKAKYFIINSSQAGFMDRKFESGTSFRVHIKWENCLIIVELILKN